jgi:GxxExxY protein
MDINDLTFKIRGAIFEVHKTLGPGLFESVYEAALIYELKQLGLNVSSQLALDVKYKDIDLGLGFKIDVLVEDSVIIELKSVETLLNIHKKQLLNYLKLTGKKIGILVNFNESVLVDKVSIIRIAN